MNEKEQGAYEFGPFRLDPVNRVLLRDGRAVALTPKMFEILLLLLERRGQVVEKEEIMRAIWPDVFVEEGNLTVNISGLRKALGQVPGGRDYIETVQRRGYRFEVPVEREKSDQTHCPEGAYVESRAVSRVNHPRSAKRYSIAAALGLMGIVVIFGGGLGLGLYARIEPLTSQTAAAFQTMKLSRLTTTGKAVEAAISRDGKYLAYVTGDNTQQRLWLRQTGAEAATEISQNDQYCYGGVAFSADSQYLYFRRAEKAVPPISLYRMSLPDGPFTKLSVEAHSAVTFSPDGKRMAFIRYNPETRGSALIIAQTDGAGERTLSVRRPPENFLRAPAWSPDGKVIACQYNTNGGLQYRIVTIPVDGGPEKIISTELWEVSHLTWLLDGRGLVMTAIQHTLGSIPSNSQVWRIDYPSGEARRITNDLNQYRGVSVAADGKTLVTIQMERTPNLWVIPQKDAKTDAGLASQITFGDGREDGVAGLDWTPDGRVVYTSKTGGKRHIWRINADGSGAEQLTHVTRDWGYDDPSVTPDGRWMVYVSAFDYPHLWRLDLGSREAKQISFGQLECYPALAPDGSWIAYTAVVDNRPVLMRMPIDGKSAPQQLMGKNSERPVISPDGKMIAFIYSNDQWAPGPPKTVIIPSTGGAPIRTLNLFQQQTLRWTPDSKGLAYMVTHDGITNLWEQPITGGPPKALTNFKDKLMYNYAWSRDGKRLACVRGDESSDVVMIQGFN
jgi:Tol biopolymer transport system component/DNA-binding winged helix-turn-helix (wHTH) protein